MRYEVYKFVENGDDELIASGLTEQQAEELKKENPDYVIVPQFINRA